MTRDYTDVHGFIESYDCTGATMSVDLDLTAITKTAVVSRSRCTYRDPDNGFMYRGVMSESTREASVSGTVAGHSFYEAYGRIGTSSFRESYHQR